MNNLQYTPLEFRTLLRRIVRRLDSQIHHELNNTSEMDRNHLIQISQKLDDLSTLTKDLILVTSQTSEVTYYVSWHIDITYKQIPNIQLNVHPVSESDYFPFLLSLTLNHYILKDLLAIHTIPNPWSIS